ncbi:MAG: sigma 54-interacting transcriptional regulator [Desulfobacterales bacterium]|nr:sigma 54-interacting transcriptional regulator [Desulfobacterales bacterium]
MPNGFENSKILIVDDEQSIRFNFTRFLTGEGYDVKTAIDFDSAIELLVSFEPDLVIADIILGGHTGIDLLREIKGKMRCPVIMITGEPNIDTSSVAVRLGAFDYLSKPIRKFELLKVVLNALELKQLKDKNEEYKSNVAAIFRSIKSSIMTVNKNMQVTECNSSAFRICGIDPKEVIGNNINSIKTQCNRECFNVLRKTLVNNITISEHLIECNCTNRLNQTVIVNSTPLMNPYKKCIGAVLLVRDITRLRKLENSLKEQYNFHNIIGKSDKMQSIFAVVDNLSNIDTTVLITGESGTGKELIGRALHYSGARSDQDLVTVNCSALSENLLESELFGHVKGSFTGAVKDKTGRFQLADKGTIFLDEIGDISHHIQLRLLRVLQEKEIEKVGDYNPIKVDVRIVAATNCNLQDKISKGLFREDLYYRLKVVEIKMPPLRERREDIPFLIEHILSDFNKKFKKSINDVSKDVMNLFLNYRWNGNVRELKNILEHAYIVCNKSVIHVNDLPQEIFQDNTVNNVNIKNDPEKIEEIFNSTGKNITKTAQILGVSRPTLYSKLKKYNISN